MTTRYLVDNQGNYIGAFAPNEKSKFNTEGVKIGADLIYPDTPEDLIDVTNPPEDGRQKWDGTEWLPLDTSITNKNDIIALEATITPRRLREAILTPAGKSWLQAVEAQIVSKRPV